MGAPPSPGTEGPVRRTPSSAAMVSELEDAEALGREQLAIEERYLRGLLHADHVREAAAVAHRARARGKQVLPPPTPPTHPRCRHGPVPIWRMPPGGGGRPPGGCPPPPGAQAAAEQPQRAPCGAVLPPPRPYPPPKTKIMGGGLPKMGTSWASCSPLPPPPKSVHPPPPKVHEWRGRP